MGNSLRVIDGLWARWARPQPERRPRSVIPSAFDGRVLLLQGDSHQFVADNPLGLANFTRIVVHGATLPFEYLRLTIDPRDAGLFRWERVQVVQP